MLEVEIPGRGELALAHAVLDVNGTIACDGELLPGVAERLRALGCILAVHLITADTHGGQDRIDRELGLTAIRLPGGAGQGERKAELVRRLSAAQVVAVGNGANDALMLEQAALGIAIVGPEGAAAATLRAADGVVPDVVAALDLLLRPRRRVATLRT